MEVKDFVISIKEIEEINKYSVGIINEKINDNYLVYFIGNDKLLKVQNDSIKKINIYKTGKGYANKICNNCHQLKPLKEFDKNQTDAKGMFTTRPSCRNCRKIIDGVSLLNDEKLKLENIKPKKGSIFVCPICNKRSIVGVTANIVKDHDHNTGLAREWICDSCNTGLGRFKDDIKMFEKIIEYLKRFQNN